MNFYNYIGITPGEFRSKYIEGGYVDEQKHAEFPLAIYSYSRQTVKEQLWDGVTSKCRGIIVNRDTGDVVARPFVKFHNFESSNMPETAPATNPDLFARQPVIWEKMDGFLCTLYTWDGIDYIASGGSFHSTHAKWATAWYRKKFGASAGFDPRFTPVFEGLCPSLRIVVDYENREELVLLAMIHVETGGELLPRILEDLGVEKNLTTPIRLDTTWQKASKKTLNVELNQEGYVLTWYSDGTGARTPTRLKMKFIEYLRLHRMVAGVSPKRVWEVLAGEQTAELTEWLEQSTPWFSQFVTKWSRALTTEYWRIEKAAADRFLESRLAVSERLIRISQDAQQTSINIDTLGFDFAAQRKAYASEFLKPENKEFAPVLFAMLDGKKFKPVIWKMVKRMTAGGSPMIDAHTT